MTAPDRAAELERPARLVAVPERHLARLARRGRDHDAVERDVLDPPRGRAEQEHLAAPALVHHLLVELADAAAVGDEHAEEAAVGDRAAVRDRERARRPRARGRAGAPVPHDPRPELGELVGGVPARQQVEHGARTRRRTARRSSRPAARARRARRRPLVDRAHRDDLLREHVERVPRVARLLDQAGAHPLHDDRGLEQVAAVLREDLAAAGLADLVAGAPDALQPARDRARRLDLHHEVDRAHVDAELERGRRDDRPQRALLQRVLDLDRCSRAIEPWCARTRSSPASSFSRAASRSAIRRAFTNTIVERCARISSSSSGWIDGQIEPRGGAGRRRPEQVGADLLARRRRRARPCPRPGR